MENDPTRRIEDAQLIKEVLQRPRMFCEAESVRELLLFMSGICCGRRPPHGSDCLPGFDEYVRSRLRTPPEVSWSQALEAEFRTRPLFEACGAILGIVEDWEATEP